MRASSLRPLILLLVLLMAPVVAHPQAPKSRFDSVTSIQYRIRYLDVHSAQVLVWDQCPPEMKEICRVASIHPEKGGLYLEVRADAATHEKIARALARQDRPYTQRFQIVLLGASTRPNGSPTDLPAGAQKALQDLREFLPYKSYAMLGTAWFQATQGDVVQGQLSGRGDQTFDYRFRFNKAGIDEQKELFVDLFHLEKGLGTPRPTPAAEQQEGQPAPAPPAARIQRVISTSFGLGVGETVVVGTSQIEGTGDALVVLLSTIPDGGSKREGR
ncbi:MAG TPA: hypothetical protein VE685_05825 [Thermoanaerobaculia bacterium]|nr:hypothetical protein [Thermoanaerobaculia bacterium]